MIRADLHTHSKYSTDAHSSIEEMAFSAVLKGLDTLCLTEHMDYANNYNHSRGFMEEYKSMPPDFFEKAFKCDTPSFQRELFLVREKYKGRLSLLFGMELGLLPELGDHYRTYTESFPFDFIIGSSHECHGTDPYYPDFINGTDPIAAYHDYFQTEIACARGNLAAFDVFGHIDYALRYHCPKDFIFSYREFSDELDTLLRFLIENGRGIECNTGGFKYFGSQPNPRIDILKRYRELGGEIITVGSDAHHHENIAAHFDRAEAILKECGFSFYTIYKERKPLFIPLS